MPDYAPATDPGREDTKAASTDPASGGNGVEAADDDLYDDLYGGLDDDVDMDIVKPSGDGGDGDDAAGDDAGRDGGETRGSSGGGGDGAAEDVSTRAVMNALKVKMQKGHGVIGVFFVFPLFYPFFLSLLCMTKGSWICSSMCCTGAT